MFFVKRISFLIYFIGCLVSCRSEMDSTLESSKNPPIKGHFQVVSLNSFYKKDSAYIPVVKTYPINTSEMRTKFDLDHEGLGKITGVGVCNPSKDAMFPAAKINSVTGVNALMGSFGIVGLVLQAVNLVDCAVHGAKPRESAVVVLPHHSLVGGDRLPANIGFAGGPHRDDANPECKKLKYVRYVKLNSDFISCIGFEDKRMNQLKMVQIKDGDVKAQRILLRRVK